MIRRNVELESQLIDDLLDLTRITRDKLQLTLSPIDAHEAISNVVEICRAELTARGLQLHMNLRAEMHHIAADPAKIQQIIWNLLKNAIKFTGEKGEIAVSTTNPSPGWLEITVQDNGIGIEPDLLARIFDPFEQGAQSFHKRAGGLGLGLAISKSLTQAHGGTLVARSDGRNKGARFVVSMRTIAPMSRRGDRQPRDASAVRAAVCESCSSTIIRTRAPPSKNYSLGAAISWPQRTACAPPWKQPFRTSSIFSSATSRCPTGPAPIS